MPKLKFFLFSSRLFIRIILIFNLFMNIFPFKNYELNPKNYRQNIIENCLLYNDDKPKPQSYFKSNSRVNEQLRFKRNRNFECKFYIKSRLKSTTQKNLKHLSYNNVTEIPLKIKNPKQIHNKSFKHHHNKNIVNTNNKTSLTTGKESVIFCSHFNF